MSRVVLTPAARSDLDGIWDCTANRGGIDPAERYVRRIAEAAELIAETPERGSSCDHVREGYRKFPVGSHVLFYREMSGGIDMIRILHRQMEFHQHLP
jgi:toxin ParE1/3/4